MSDFFLVDGYKTLGARLEYIRKCDVLEIEEMLPEFNLLRVLLKNRENKKEKGYFASYDDLVFLGFTPEKIRKMQKSFRVKTHRETHNKYCTCGEK